MQAYVDTIIVSDVEYKGHRNMSTGQILIPYTNVPKVGIGDTIVQKSGTHEIYLKVTDLSIKENGTLNVDTQYPHLLTLQTVNMTAQPHLQSNSPTFHISGGNVQVGNNNTLGVNINIQELTKQIANSTDGEAKSKLKELLNNSTVATLIGAGVLGLLGLL